MDLKLKNNNNIVIPLYNQVEYIESIGTPNINTGINVTMYWTDGYIIECVIEVLENVSGNSPQIYFNDNSNDGYLGMKCSGDSDNTFLVYGRTSKDSVSYATIEFNGKVTIQQKGYYSNDSNNYIIVNGVQTTLHPGNVARTLGNIRILNSGEVRTRIYSFKIRKYSGSGDVYNTVRDYIPVISLQSDHIGEACLYDRVSNSYYYSAPTGSFTAPTQGLYDIINTIYIKDCPSISGIDVLRKSYNLERVRCDLGNVTGHLSEIYKYSNLSGFNDNYENQTKPRLIGTFNIDDYYTNSEIYSISEKLDGTTINTLDPTQYNIDTLLENDDLAVQTLDSTKPNYNPAAAIRLYANGYGHTIVNPLLTGEGKFFITKDEAAAITSVGTTFTGVNTVTDTNSIVTDDSTATYNFTTFNEFKYFGVTSLPSAPPAGGFSNSTILESIELPEGLTTISQYNFRNLPALNRIVFPSTLTTIADYNFSVYNTPVANSHVYFNGTIEQWINIVKTSYPTKMGVHFYINNQEVTDLVIPDGVTTIKYNAFLGMKYITNVTLPSTVTTLQDSAFRECTGLICDFIYPNITSVGNYALYNCNKLKNVDIRKTTVNNTRILNCGDGSHTLRVKAFSRESTNVNPLRFKHVLCYGSYSATDAYYIVVGKYTETLRFAGSYSCNSNYIGVSGNSNYGKVIFIELMGTFTGSGGFARINIFNRVSGDIIHLGYNGIALAPEKIQASYSYITNIYVGDGSSRQNDEDVLALYLADTDWSAYSTKLATWYDYNGKYKWYRVTDNLTNCTNTNPVDWPYITRGESYETTIVANEGMTIDSVTVEMYEAVDNGTTPNTPTDITNDVYNASTGEINIPSVTGNIIITAMAS